VVRGTGPWNALYPTINALTVKGIIENLGIAALGEPTKRPSVKGRFQKHSEVMLYDTGSAITCMSGQAYRRLQPDDVLKTEKIHSATFASAIGNKILSKKKVVL